MVVSPMWGHIHEILRILFMKYHNEHVVKLYLNFKKSNKVKISYVEIVEKSTEVFTKFITYDA